MIDGINGSTYGDLGLGVPRTVVDDELGQEDFLHLMITQLKNQDPFKPMESGEFLGQLAQFGTVEGLAGLQTSFDSLSSSLVSNQALQAAGLVGRSALAVTDEITLGAGQTVAGAVDLPAATGAVRVSIRDAAGHVVKRLELGGQPAGLAAFAWDGLTESGAAAPAGRYTFDAEFLSGDEIEAADTLLSSSVDSVSFDSTGFRVQLRGIGELPFTAVREIRNPVIDEAASAAAETATD